MSTSALEKVRKPLAERLIAEGMAIVAEGGPESLSLREVQRRAGVSPAAAYRHFRDRDDLMHEIAQEAAGVLADHLASAMDAVPAPPGDLDAARARLLAASRAYVRFAEENPGLYQAIFVSSEQIDDLTAPSERAQGEAGDGGYNLLVDAVERLVAASGSRPADPWDPLVIWSACHGLVMLRLHAALRSLPPEVFAAACDHVFEAVIGSVGWSSKNPVDTANTTWHSDCYHR